MNTKIVKLAILVGLLLPLMAAQAGAQTSQDLVADIPFNFTVCQEQMPAGTYKVLRISGTSRNLLLVQGESNSSAEIICTREVESTRAAAKGKLIFHRYGDQYFLSEIWVSGERVGRQLIKSEREEALIRQLPAAKKREKVTVTIKEVKP